jgi:xanthine dehydrogenase accessory factor
MPFAAIAALMRGHRPGIVATVLDGGPAPARAGAALVTDGETETLSAIDGPAADDLRAVALSALSASASELVHVALDGAESTVLLAVAETVPRLLVLGAGLDAAPVVRFGSELGWRCTVADHRPGYLERGDLGEAATTLCVRAETLGDDLDLDAFDAAIVMSHHLATDEHYLAALAGSGVSYVGLLGPPARRRRLMEALGERAGPLEGRLHGPAGLDLGGRGPAAIALSIVAEVHAHLAGRRGGTAS